MPWWWVAQAFPGSQRGKRVRLENRMCLGRWHREGTVFVAGRDASLPVPRPRLGSVLCALCCNSDNLIYLAQRKELPNIIHIAIFCVLQTWALC